MSLAPPLDFVSRRCLVTGAGAGIGRAIALRLARAGAAVACVDLDGEAASHVAEEIADRGGRALGLAADVSVPGDVDRAFDATSEALGGLDVLVNNAGITILKSFEESSLDEWDRTLGVNLRAMFLTCQRARSTPTRPSATAS